jgi:hypothetical protein
MAANAGDNHPLLLRTSTQAWIRRMACSNCKEMIRPTCMARMCNKSYLPCQGSSQCLTVVQGITACVIDEPGSAGLF